MNNKGRFNQFHGLGGLIEQEKEAANTRQFTVTEDKGSPYLPVPGLKKVTAVRVGSTPVPLTQTLTYPVNGANPPRFETEEADMIALTRREDGTPILLRSQLSNDGIWQPNVPIFISGEWEDDKKSKTAEEKKAEAEAKKKAEEEAKAKAAAEAKAKAEAENGN